MTEIDPVCGMEVTEEDAAAHVDWAGRTFLFCSETCRDEFAADPEQFVDLQPEDFEPAIYEG
jgi:YHS domain-containing protein